MAEAGLTKLPLTSTWTRYLTRHAAAYDAMSCWLPFLRRASTIAAYAAVYRLLRRCGVEEARCRLMPCHFGHGAGLASRSVNCAVELGLLRHATA